MIGNVEYDFANLTEKISGLSGALLGRGASEGDLEKLLKTELGQLAGRMGDAVGPRTQDAAMKKVDRDIKHHMSVSPTTSNLDEDQQESSYADFTWLYASPAALVGINDEDSQLRASGPEAMAMLRTAQRGADRGPAYVQLGTRGKQKIMRLNKIHISPATFNYLRVQIKNRTGELRAAFYRVAVKYVPRKRVPAWLKSKFNQVEANGKSSDQAAGLGTPQAFIEFAIRAPGVTSNAAISAKLAGAVNQSRQIVNEKLKKILRGYRYDWETGKVFQSRAGNADEFEGN